MNEVFQDMFDAMEVYKGPLGNETPSETAPPSEAGSTTAEPAQDAPPAEGADTTKAEKAEGDASEGDEYDLSKDVTDVDGKKVVSEERAAKIAENARALAAKNAELEAALKARDTPAPEDLAKIESERLAAETEAIKKATFDQFINGPGIRDKDGVIVVPEGIGHGIVRNMDEEGWDRTDDLASYQTEYNRRLQAQIADPATAERFNARMTAAETRAANERAERVNFISSLQTEYPDADQTEVADAIKKNADANTLRFIAKLSHDSAQRAVSKTGAENAALKAQITKMQADHEQALILARQEAEDNVIAGRRAAVNGGTGSPPLGGRAAVQDLWDALPTR